MADSIEFIVMAKAADGSSTGFGKKAFRLAPRIGEFVGLDDENGVGQIYKVKALMHPLELTMTAGDLILEYVSTDVEFRKRL